MKKLCLIIILFCFVGFAFAEEPPLFLGDDGKPFTGVRKLYPEGDETLYSEYAYINGKAHGVAKVYSKKTDEKAEKFDIEDYCLHTEMNYVDGKLDGSVKTYHQNGQLKYLMPQKNGILEGLSLVYNKEGKLVIETMYRDGKMNGVEKMYSSCKGNDYRIEHIMVDNRRHGVERIFINDRLFMSYNIFESELNRTGQKRAYDFMSIYSKLVNNIIYICN